MTPHEYKENCLIVGMIFLCSKALFDIFMREQTKPHPPVMIIAQDRDRVSMPLSLYKELMAQEKIVLAVNNK